MSNLDTKSASTQNTDAVESLQRGLKSFNLWRCDAMEHLDSATNADPDFVLAQACKGLIILGVRHTRFHPFVKQCLDAAHNNAAAASSHEREMTTVLDALYYGRINEGVDRMRGMLADDPTNLFVHRVVQQELFWMGEAGAMRHVAQSALPAWDSNHPDYGGYLSVLAFALEEAGEFSRAEDYGRQAVEIDNQDCWGTHAVAHVLEMQHRTQEGVDWLKGLSGNWQDSNIIKHHLWWHLCLFLLEHNEHDEILALLVDKVRNEESELVKNLPDAYIDLQNVASILIRLELRGVTVGDRWEPIAQYSAERIDNHTSPFTSAHAAMALAAADRLDDAERLVESMQSFANDDQHDLAPRFATAAIPAAQGAIAHRRGDYQGVVDALSPAMEDLWRMGGSHAQRDVFTQLLYDAFQRLDQKDRAQAIVTGLADTGFSHGPARSLYMNTVH